MRIAVIGATGNAGSRIVDEALMRGHRVTGISRRPESAAPRAGFEPRRGDAGEPSELAGILSGHDAVVSAVPFRGGDPARLIAAVRLSGVKRYLVVGGAGSLETAPGRLHLDEPDFPAFAREEAGKGKEFLDTLRAADDLDWTFLSPSARFVPGKRTGEFRLGRDALLRDAAGESCISFEDYAVALLDEIERPEHVRRRFTVGY